jgi:hypothetical protein
LDPATLPGIGPNPWLAKGHVGTVVDDAPAKRAA